MERNIIRGSVLLNRNMVLIRPFLLLLFLTLMFHARLFTQETSQSSLKRKPIVFSDKEQVPPPRAMFGAVIGSQTGISGLGLYSIDPYVVRFSTGFVLSGWKGAQVDVSRIVYRSGSSYHTIAIVMGVSRFEDLNTSGDSQLINEKFMGASYNVLYKGFHFQLGGGFGDGSYSHAMLLFQVGYLFKLW